MSKCLHSGVCEETDNNLTYRVQMDEDEKYLAKLEAGLYTLQLLALIMAHIWASE